MTMRFMNSKKTWMLSSLFALMMAASSLMGSETEGKEVNPEIRSSKTPIVQVANPASVRLQAEVERDGGTVEGASTIGERANASVQEAADAVYAAGNTSREFLAEQGREYLGRPGEAAGQLVGGVAQGVTALGGVVTQGTGYLTEGVTDGSVWTYNNALKPVYNLTVDGGEAVYDATKNFVIKTAPEAITDGWTWSGDQLKKFGDCVVGLFSSNEEKPAEAQTQADQQVEELAPEVQPEQVEQPTSEQLQPEPAPEEGANWFERNIVSPVVEGVEDAHNFMSENVYQPVVDALTPSETTAEPTEQAQGTVPEADKNAVQMKDSSQEKKETSFWNKITGLFNSKEEANSVQTQEKTENDSQSTQAKLTEFLKSKGLSDADIQMAVNLAQGKEVLKDELQKAPEIKSEKLRSLKDTLSQAEQPSTKKGTYELTGKKLDTTITVNGMIGGSSGR